MLIKFIKRKLFHLFLLISFTLGLLSYSILIQPIDCDKPDFIIPQGSSLPFVISELDSKDNLPKVEENKDVDSKEGK